MIRTLFLGAAGALVLGSTASAQTITRARLETSNPALLFEQLESQGFDVVGATLDDRGFEVFYSAEEYAALIAMGLRPLEIAKGRPFREILAERALEDGVPSGYPNLTQVNARMAQAAADHPAICQLVDLTVLYGMPPTSGGNHMLAVKISDNVGIDEDEPAVAIISCHHAREVVTPVLALEALDRLTDGYGNLSSITAAVDGNEIWIAPVWNPDGYEYVFNSDNNWRKNRTVFPGGIGVDQNRNYPQGWTNGCSGSSNASSSTYKGPSPASEAETQTMIAWAEDRRFAKVLDYHSFGRETLWGYACPTHPFDSFWRAEAAAMSTAANYNGDERRPSADGEHQQWHYGRQGALAFLTETHSTFQPSYASALSEAALSFGGIEWMLARPMPVSGHVTDICTGAPVAATISVLGVNGVTGETNSSGGPFGRWQAYLPAGSYTLRFEAPGYATQDIPVSIGSGTATTLEVSLGSPAAAGTYYCASTFNSVGFGALIGHTGSTSVSANDFTLVGSLMPPGQFSLFIYGQNETMSALFDGYLCVAAPFIRLPVILTSPQGSIAYPLDLANPPVPAGLITAGSTWSFQAFYRDPGYGQFGSNLSHGWRVTFCP